MRKLKQGDTVSPMAPLGNNFRPPQPLHKRAIRTNIDLIHTDRVEKTHNRGSADSDDVDVSETFSTSNCPSMEAKKFYQGKRYATQHKELSVDLAFWLDTARFCQPVYILVFKMMSNCYHNLRCSLEQIRGRNRRKK